MRFEPKPEQSPTAAARALLESQPRILKRLVRRVAAEDTPEAHAIFTLAAGKQFDFTPESWKVVLDRVDSCDMRVGEWLRGDL